MPRKRAHSTGVRYAVLGPWPHGHGFRFASLPTCADKKRLQRRVQRRGEDEKSSIPIFLDVFFCRFASRAFFSSPVCQPVFALQAFAGDSPALERAFFIFADKHVAASAAYPFAAGHETHLFRRLRLRVKP